MRSLLIILMTVVMVSMSSLALSAPAGYEDWDTQFRPPTEREGLDVNGNPIPLSSREICCYRITYTGGEQIGNDIPHVVDYVDFIFASLILPYGTSELSIVTLDTEGRVSREVTTTAVVKSPTKGVTDWTLTPRLVR
jgi:hypothetical protein